MKKMLLTVCLTAFAMCKTGKVQAPIHISTKGLAKASTPIKTEYTAS